ncbi:hypothetical protein [Anaeromyxobacter paludicola]|uniref:ATP synthase protein I n=1 Tax=Anaeromyxobacter paludicola TaxID=2918171 RepID=A0ABN6N8Z0_9BACT|nr:hypothetical protein [Anaeromyxobacter paludicola]BDG09699.1 hypothetical protein AMPC_28120 [Anaeromyxobacter paludicola]
MLTTLVAALAIGGSLVVAHRGAALTGAGIASLTAVASLWGISRASRGAKKPVQAALAVFTLVFLVRILLVALGTALVARSGLDAIAFVAAFFVPYFAFSAIEGAFVHSLARSGTTA